MAGCGDAGPPALDHSAAMLLLVEVVGGVVGGVDHHLPEPMGHVVPVGHDPLVDCRARWSGVIWSSSPAVINRVSSAIHDRRRQNFDRHAAYVVVAFVAGG